MANKNVTVVLDAQAGSSGKGKFIGYLAKHDNPSVSICNFMPNAGHTYIDKNKKIVTQQLPTSIVNPSTIICIGPESAITPHILFEEIIKYRGMIGPRHINIHPNAVVITQEHRNKEMDTIRSGSTFKGCGFARADKVTRQAMLFGEFWNKMCNNGFGYDSEFSYCCQLTHDEFKIIDNIVSIVDTTRILNASNIITTAQTNKGMIPVESPESILIEGSQGCDLDINFGLGYPHTTSRQCHTGQLIADSGLSPFRVKDIIMIMRPYPIRISNMTGLADEDGTPLVISSGDYAGSKEISWDEVKRRCGAPDDVAFGEQTTVTKKTRRVFEMNWKRLDYVVALNEPTQIALNFVQYLDWNSLHCKIYDDLPSKVKDFVGKIESRYNIPVTLIGTGADNMDIIDRRQ